MYKPKIVLVLNNPEKVGGPTVAMRRIESSFLSNKYEFTEVHITERLGKIPRWKLIKRLVKEFKNIKPDIIHISGLQLHGFYAVLSARLAGIKNIALVVRGSSCDALTIGRLSKFIFGKILEPITIRMSGITYTVCSEMAENPIVKNNVKKLGVIIHNPAPIIEYKEYSRSNFRRELGVSDSDILAVYTGRIVEDKGISYALNALRSISNPNLKIVLVGDGQDESKFKKNYNDLISSKKLYFLGKRSDVFNILAGCDIYIFPTLHENLSNALLEACVMGLAVIATDVGGNPEVIRNGIDGILIPPRDELAIGKALNVLAKNSDIRKTLGENARKRMKDTFSSETIYNKIDEVYQEILTKNEYI